MGKDLRNDTTRIKQKGKLRSNVHMASYATYDHFILAFVCWRFYLPADAWRCMARTGSLHLAQREPVKARHFLGFSRCLCWPEAVMDAAFPFLVSNPNQNSLHLKASSPLAISRGLKVVLLQMLEVAVVVTAEEVEVVSDSGQGGGDGDSGQGGGGGGMAFTEEQFFQGATQDSSHGAPLMYNRRQKFSHGGHAGGSPVDSNRYDTMISDFVRMSTQESVGSYGDHSYHPESTSTDTDYSSGYRPYSGYTATAGYLGPSLYMYPPPVAFFVPILVQVFAPLEDVQMAQLNVVRPGCQMWDHYLRLFQQRYHTMMTWDEYRNFVSKRKGYHIIGELPSKSDESESVPSQSQ
ncbi:hypothetical protein Taro_041949 [Colocasia esculenta]|uniref:Uncharacterized protein n=1 Tax=Colocasia esculenta TaxID=4460 RepID=A0A843WCQ1_COLES|nr:hypothetical protein [Colocasia esculenta]